MFGDGGDPLGAPERAVAAKRGDYADQYGVTGFDEANGIPSRTPTA